ncbi:M24 family metallopeptidase [Lacticaseibacillus thailandensis]|uniref:M24 family metallopeptidase n=1 Tax=Lacticaseibacillus thailandensis TaxID=381741 RepID=UPI000AA1F3C5|nr:Xaa-Pro peptidase family protein [Lacticaseibacillus thailandensis]
MAKIEELRRVMRDQDLKAIVLTDPVNVSYVSDFSGDESALLVTLTQAYLVTDSRFIEVAKHEIHAATVVEHHHGLLPAVGKLADQDDVKELGFEAEYMTFADYQVLAGATAAQLRGTRHLVAGLREVKSPAEVALIQKAVDIAEDGYRHVLATIRPGMTERAVANDLDFYMRGLGASGVSFDTIVASGYRSALPHGFADDKAIEAGDVVTLDWGCTYHGYMSDLTRTFAIGTPDPQLDKIYRLVYQANRGVAAMMRPGVLGKDIQAQAHQPIDAAGYQQNFGHGAGHGIGRDIHEGPGAWGVYMETPIVAGNVLTDEPESTCRVSVGCASKMICS